MMLHENIHFKEKKYSVGKLRDAREYCYDVFDGTAHVIEITHPDVNADDIIKHGDHLRKLRMARNKTLEKTRRKR